MSEAGEGEEPEPKNLLTQEIIGNNLSQIDRSFGMVPHL